MLDIALILFFGLVSLYSAVFIARRYQMATPMQRRQIVIAVAGAGAVAVAMYCAVAFR